MQKTISIVGSGWLAQPLAQHFMALGNDVSMSTTREDKCNSLIQNGFKAFLLNAHFSDEFSERLAQSDEIIITVPPGKKPENLQKIIVEVCKRANQKCRIHYTSSTGVYRSQSAPNKLTVVEENFTVSGMLAETEKILIESGRNYVIFRLGGLCGPGRHPGRFLAGKKNIPDGNIVTNLVHLQDVIQAMTSVINAETEHEIYNITADFHPQRRDFYPFAAEQAGFDKPEFEACGAFPAGIYVSNEKIKRQFELRLVFPDPFGFMY